VIKLEVPDVVTAIDVLGQLLNRKKLLLDRSIFETTKKLRAFEEREKEWAAKISLKNSRKDLPGTTRMPGYGLLSTKHLDFLRKSASS